jgi:hypothetical protein
LEQAFNHTCSINRIRGKNLKLMETIITIVIIMLIIGFFIWRMTCTGGG